MQHDAASHPAQSDPQTQRLERAQAAGAHAPGWSSFLAPARLALVLCALPCQQHAVPSHAAQFVPEFSAWRVKSGESRKDLQNHRLAPRASVHGCEQRIVWRSAGPPRGCQQRTVPGDVAIPSRVCLPSETSIDAARRAAPAEQSTPRPSMRHGRRGACGWVQGVSKNLGL
jgi:hypothetical protein